MATRRTAVATLAALFVLCALIGCADAKYFEGTAEGGKGTWFKYITKFSYSLGSGSARIVKVDPKYNNAYPEGEFFWGFVMDTAWDEFRETVEKGHCAKDLLGPRFTPMDMSVRAVTTNIRPHVWYFVFLACHSQGEVRAESWFEFLNNGSHFSYDDTGMLTTHFVLMIFVGLLFAFVARSITVNRKVINMTHPIIKVFVAALLLAFLALAFEYLHLQAYQYNGRGSATFDTLSELMHLLSELVVTALLTFMAWGWTIDTNSLPEKPLLQAFAGMSIIHLLLFYIGNRYDDHHDKHHDRETYAGLFLVFLRLMMYGTFFAGLTKTKEKSATTGRVAEFWTYFTWLASIWFLSWPITHFVSSLFAQYLRHTVNTAGSYAVHLTTLTLLCQLLLTRGRYFKISTIGSTILPGLDKTTGSH